MKKELVAFAGFEGRDEQLIKLPRVACALLLENKGVIPLSIKIGSDGRFYNEFILYPDYIFQESVPSFTEILISLRIEEPKPPYQIVTHYVGYAYYRGY